MLRATLCCVLFPVALGCNQDAASRGPEVPLGGPHPFETGAERPHNPTCRAPERPAGAIELVAVLTDLDFQMPVALVQAGPESGERAGRWFLLDQRGIVHSLHMSASGAAEDTVQSDLSALVQPSSDWRERGMLGMAVHPGFPDDPRIFLAYTRSDEGSLSRLSSFRVERGVIDAGSEVTLLDVAQPHANHNGGCLAFGPDGLLYYGLGDGGGAGDPDGNGQNKDSLLGSILRLDVDSPSAGRRYSIPPDNPFANGGGAPEIYAYGLRNPWRFSFDRDTGELWAGDVGQADWEEIDIIVRGGNYGWNRKEGEACYPIGSDSCNAQGLVDPVHVYFQPPRQQRSVTGGYVYRGSDMPDLVGFYLFADYRTGEIWRLAPRAADHEVTLLLESGLSISSFAEGRDGELFVLDYGSDRVLRVTQAAGETRALPALLSQTGCVNPDDPTEVTSAAVPYDIALPFWSDGAEKRRYLALPDDAQLTLTSDGDIELPRGGVTIKAFFQDGRPLETRFFVRHDDGEYSGYAYAFRDDLSDAELVEATTTRRVDGLDWVTPGRSDCNQCHTAAAGGTLGLEAPQIDIFNSEVRVNQVDALRRLGMLEGDARAGVLPTDTDLASEEELARAYLHVNCSGCHRPRGPGRGSLDLRFRTQLSETGLCDAHTFGALDSNTGKLLEPGSREQSVAFLRMTRRDSDGMPPLSSLRVDDRGAARVGRWIDALGACP